MTRQFFALPSAGRFVVLTLALCLSTPSWGGDRLEVVSQRSFPETVQQLRWAFGGYGLTIVSSMNYQQILKKLKFESGSAVVFEVMRREWLKALISVDPSLGVALPIRIYVYQRDDGKTVVTYRKISDELTRHDKDSVTELAMKLDMKVEAIVAQAARLHLSRKATNVDSQ